MSGDDLLEHWRRAGLFTRVPAARNGRPLVPWLIAGVLQILRVALLPRLIALALSTQNPKAEGGPFRLPPFLEDSTGRKLRACSRGGPALTTLSMAAILAPFSPADVSTSTR